MIKNIRFKIIFFIIRVLYFMHEYLQIYAFYLLIFSCMNLGKSGLRVSCVGLGTWVTFGGQVTEEISEEIITLAYESGINFFDTAEVYAAGKRSSYIVSTKLYWGGKFYKTTI
ncbi:hypothetical protein KUTeg_002111 [Tegillarca granosa]|uniref:NADP-dependent oxidoreductase domain-containing protein n=1 Tax=Tegillarca granosa TaxID=220873 RepID=A0ABQ9FTD8_TEGGR|nr:hypothetical protein KUTeg_002111 [Tegillarca granosa]